jgi:hypothetical protein
MRHRTMLLPTCTRLPEIRTRNLRFADRRSFGSTQNPVRSYDCLATGVAPFGRVWCCVFREGEAPAEPNARSPLNSLIRPVPRPFGRAKLPLSRTPVSPPDSLGSAGASSLWEGEAPAEPNTCQSAEFPRSAGASSLREGEAPAEPNPCQSAGSSGSAGASPSQG